MSKKGPGQFSTLRAVLYGLKQGCSLCFAISDTWPQQQPSLWRTRRRRRSTEHGEGRRRRGRPPGGGAGHRARGTAACPVAPRVRARDRLRPPAPPRPFVLDGPAAPRSCRAFHLLQGYRRLRPLRPPVAAAGRARSRVQRPAAAGCWCPAPAPPPGGRPRRRRPSPGSAPPPPGSP